MTDIELAESALQSADLPQVVTAYNPAHEVEASLVSLLKHRIGKLQEDESFEEQIKAAMIDRLPEATYSELLHTLDKVQINKNTSVERILSPFIPRVGDRIPLLDTDKNIKSVDEQVFDKSTKKDLDALAEFSKLLKVLNTMEDKKEEITPLGSQ